MHKVTVIVPNYNHAQYLPKRIESVINQTYNNIEILLLDDCSTDDSRSVLQHYSAIDKRIQLVFNEKNSGSTFKQWNKGIALATGKYVWIAESDDYADNDFLSKLVAKLESDEKIGLAYCSSWFIDENNKLLHTDQQFFASLDPLLWTHDFVEEGLLLIRKYMFNRNIIPNASAVVIRLSVLNQVGPADATKKLNGDWLYWARILSISKVAYLANSLNYFRQHYKNVRSTASLNGTDIEETTELLITMRQYGEPEPVLYQTMLDYLYYKWFNGMAYSKIPLARHASIYQNMRRIDSKVTQCILNFLFKNKMSGIRIVVGDGILYPIWAKIKKR